MPVTPVNPQVTVNPPSTDANGNAVAASCSPFTVNPKGRNATIVFRFPPGQNSWGFAVNAFQIKSNSPQPPGGMFFPTNFSNASLLVIQDRNDDDVKYIYSIAITNGTTTVTIDPEIQNDSEQ
jgi:hypothetical protein